MSHSPTPQEVLRNLRAAEMPNDAILAAAWVDDSVKALVRADIAKEREAFAPLVAALDKEMKRANESIAKVTDLHANLEAKVQSAGFATVDAAANALPSLKTFMSHFATASKPRRSGDGAKADMEWSKLVGKEPMWLAILTVGKSGPMKTAGVYYVVPPATADSAGTLYWRTAELKYTEESMSVAASQTGRVRGKAGEGKGATEAFAHAILHAYGVEGVTVDASFIRGYAILDVNGHPTEMSADEQVKAFRKREADTMVVNF